MKQQHSPVLPWPEWEIVKELGHGGYGTVYQAQRSVSGITEQAAIKVISFPKSQDEIDSDLTDGYDIETLKAKYNDILQNYLREYNIMKELNGQTNIVNCADFATVPHEDGIGWDVFIRMELLTPLTVLMRQKKLTEADVLKIGKDICRALILCETKNIIHRDIKPENIMVSEFGDYKLGDFGIARTMNHSTNATMVGTERYMAPEVIRREKYGKDVDIYSLGLVLYWMLNNRKIPFIDADSLPYADELNRAQSRRVSGEPLPPPRDGSDEFKRIVLKACSFQPKDRYASANEMYRDLSAIKAAEEDALSVPAEDAGVPADSSDEEFLETKRGITSREIPEDNYQKAGWDPGSEETEKTIGAFASKSSGQAKGAGETSRISEAEKRSGSQQTTSSKSKLPLILIAIAVAAGVIAAVVFLPGSKGSGGSGGSSVSSSHSEQKVTGISIIVESSMEAGNAYSLMLNVSGVGIFGGASEEITWTVDHPEVAYVDKDSKDYDWAGMGGATVYAVSEGTVTLTAEFRGYTDSLTIEVKPGG